MGALKKVSKITLKYLDKIYQNANMFYHIVLGIISKFNRSVEVKTQFLGSNGADKVITAGEETGITRQATVSFFTETETTMTFLNHCC